MDQAAGLRGLLAGPPLRTLVVTAASQSAGHSSLAANLATTLAGRDLEVLLLDAAGAPRGAIWMLGLEPAHDLLTAVRGGCPVDAVGVRRGRGLRVVDAQRALACAPHFTERESGRLVKVLSDLSAGADAVIVNAVPGALGPVAAAEHVVMVTRDDPDAVTRTYRFLKRIAGTIDCHRLSVVMNGVQASARAERIFGNLARTASQFLSLPLECMGQIPDDERLQRAALLRQPVMELFPASPAALALRACADALFTGRGSPEHAATAFPARLLGALRTTLR